MRTLRLAFVAIAAGCGGAPPSSGPPADVVGPFPGATYRFAVDQLVMPLQRADFADDLNGDKHADNQLGNVAGGLAAEGDLDHAVADLLASGALGPVVEITTDDPMLRDSSAPVGVRFLGADGEAADTMGATLHGGYLESNRTRWTTHPATLTLHLPMFAAADPTPVTVVGAEIELSADGRGGFYGKLHGGAHGVPIDAVYAGFLQMIRARPEDHGCSYAIYDRDRDGTITRDEFASSMLTQNLLAPDVQLFLDGEWAPQQANAMRDSLSIGFSFHLVPCAQGRCAGAVADPCDDRVRDGDETDVDCGGSCHPCPGAAACAVAADCQSATCDTGKCTEPPPPMPGVCN